MKAVVQKLWLGIGLGAGLILLPACSNEEGPTPSPDASPTGAPLPTQTPEEQPTHVTTPSGVSPAVQTETPEASTPSAVPSGTPLPTLLPTPLDTPPVTVTPSPWPSSAEAVEACQGLSAGDACQYLAPDGTTLGTCVLEGAVLTCAPAPLPPAEFDMDQTLSDGAQRNTIAFDGLGMVTGNLEAQSFFPPGKVADYWGFQYLRDNDPDDMGHNTDFLTRAANNVLYILSDSQLDLLKALAISQESQIDQYGYERYTLMQAFRLALENALPSGTSALSRQAVEDTSRRLYELDGALSFDRAILFADVYRTLDDPQRSWLDAMVGVGFYSWPDIADEEVKAKTQGLTHTQKVAVMTYAGDLFSWYAGSVEADVYFCPERQGTYFGSFYMKDAPAVGHSGYSIDQQLTANAGDAFLDELAKTGLDTHITDLVDIQRDTLYASETDSIVLAREDISILLRRLITWEPLSEEQVADLRRTVLERSSAYGALDGSLVFEYASAFATVSLALNDSQRQNLDALRQSLLSGVYSDGTPYDYTDCTTYYLYSSVIEDTAVLDPFLIEAETLFE